MQCPELARTNRATIVYEDKARGIIIPGRNTLPTRKKVELYWT